MDTVAIEFACRNWNLRSTDIMQGVVFGLMNTSEDLITRFDYDEYFGTAINRFCAQALINHPLTVYGLGKQTRGWLPLQDSIQCLTIAVKKPPKEGEYRTLNQFDEVYSVSELAENVKNIGEELDLKVEIENIENPRVEAEEHYYNPDHEKLKKLGFKPTHPLQKELKLMLSDLIKYKGRIEEKRDRIKPTVMWRA